MAIIGQGPSRAYGFNAYVDVFPFPIVTNRAPVNGQDGGINGQVWVDTVGQDAYTMVDTNTSFWVNTGGGAGLFAALTVNPGPVAITSTLTTITAIADVADVFKLVTGAGAGVASTFTISNTVGTAADSINIKSTLGGIQLYSDQANPLAIDIRATNAGGGVNLIAGNQGVLTQSTGGELLFITNRAGDDAIALQASAGGITFDGRVVGINAIHLNAATTAGSGINIDAGTAGIDADSTGSISLTSTLNNANAISLVANGGANETVFIGSTQGTLATSVSIGSVAGGVTIETAAAAKDVTLSSILGSINLLAGEVAADAIVIAAANGSAQLTAGQAVATAIVIEATNAAGGVQIKGGSNGILIGTDGDTAILSMGDVIPTAARTTTIAGGTIGSAIADTIDIAPDGANFAGSSKIVNIATGALVAGTQTVNIATGAVTGAEVQAVNIGTGTGTKTISLGNADALTDVSISALKTTAAGTTVIVNGRSGTAVFTGLTTAAAAIEVITITNSAAVTSSGVLLTVANAGTTATDAQMTIRKVESNTGSIEITLQNNGAAALDSDLMVSFMILS